MKNLHLSLLAIIFTLFQLGNLTPAYANTLYPVEIGGPTPKVKLLRVTIQHENDQHVLRGKVKRSFFNSLVLPGHIDYSIINTNDQVIEKGIIKYGPSLSLRRWKHGSRFEFILPKNLPETVRIKLDWHKNQGKKPTSKPINLKRIITL